MFRKVLFEILKDLCYNKEELGEKTYRCWYYASRQQRERGLKENNLYEYRYLLDSQETLANRMKQKAKICGREFPI